MTTREVISTGSVALDGTGDTLRSGGNKINSNFATIWNWAGGDSNELPTTTIFTSDGIILSSNTPSIELNGTDSDINISIVSKNRGAVVLSKIVHEMSTITIGGNVPRDHTYININSGGAIALDLLDGQTSGELKIFTNQGVGTATITPSNFAQGVEFVLTQNQACEAIWNGSNWFIKSNQSTMTIS